VTSNGGGTALSPDGGSAYYVKEGLWKMPVGGGAESRCSRLEGFNKEHLPDLG